MADDEKSEEESGEEEQEIVMNPDEIEDSIVENFLSHFLIGSESTFLDNIDITLMLRAMPTPIVDYNLYQMKMFNFSILQSAIIAFQNEDKVSAFEFYDRLNRERVGNVRELIFSQKKNLDRVDDIMQQVKNKVQQNERILSEYQEMWEQLANEKKQIDRQHKQGLLNHQDQVNMLEGAAVGDGANRKKKKKKRQPK